MIQKIIAVVIACTVIGGLLFAYIKAHDAAKIGEGIDRQVAADIALSNQNIAMRRATDAKFDKDDAAAVCRIFKREWVFIDGKSQCN